MPGLKLRRVYTRITSDFIPGVLGKIPLGKFRYGIPQPHGRERPATTSHSMAVPFEYPFNDRTTPLRVAVVCHLFHAELSTWLLKALSRLGQPADVYISTNTHEK